MNVLTFSLVKCFQMIFISYSHAGLRCCSSCNVLSVHIWIKCHLNEKNVIHNNILEFLFFIMRCSVHEAMLTREIGQTVK